MPASIAIIGEFNPDFAPHLATNVAIEHSSARLGVTVDQRWISTVNVDESVVRAHHGLWIAPGSPYKDMTRALVAIRYARENQIPCLGTCGGFQHMIIEYARNVLGFCDARHAEYDPYASNLFVSKLDCSLIGRSLKLRFAADSFVADCYGSAHAVESYYCDFGVRPDRVDALRSGALRDVGSDNEGQVRVVELPGHPFFVGTLFVPQAQSTPDAPHPLVTAFVQATASRASQGN